MITQLGSHDHTHLGLNEHPLLGSHDHPLLGSRHSRQSLKWASGEQQVELDEHSSECPFTSDLPTACTNAYTESSQFADDTAIISAHE